MTARGSLNRVPRGARLGGKIKFFEGQLAIRISAAIETVALRVCLINSRMTV
jgi:hypothetical protein